MPFLKMKKFFQNNMGLCNILLQHVVMQQRTFYLKDNFEKKNKKLKMNFEDYTMVHSAPFHTSEMEPFAKIVNALRCQLFSQNASSVIVS